MPLRLPPRLFRLAMNWWPPFRGAGIRVRSIAPDWHAVEVELRPRAMNRNPHGAHFGGSLFAMTDPFYALILQRHLGPDYRIWDQWSSIEFLKPGEGIVSARFELAPQEIERVRQAAAGGAKVLPEYVVEVRDRHGAIVARVQKRVYVRLRRGAQA
jgi:acyl-coenzyme A thioesterase PaaI-like protein